MTNELVRKVMNNISKRNIEQEPRTNNCIRVTNNQYEYQKKIALSNYGSAKELNYKDRDKIDKKPINLNSLADEVRGRVKTDKPLESNGEFTIKAKRENKLTLQDLTKMAGGKSEEAKSDKSLKDTFTQKSISNKGLTLNDLANNMKKNI